MLDVGQLYTIHGILMAVGWLILVPAGIWMSTVGKRRYPESWFCYHSITMAIASITIFSAATIAFYVTSPHYDSFHAILGPILNIMLLVQALGGLLISMMEPTQQRPFINKAHKFMGLLLYLGGLTNGALGLHDYSMSLTCRHAIYLLAMLMGVVLAVHCYLLTAILPAWWDNWHHDPQRQGQMGRLLWPRCYSSMTKAIGQPYHPTHPHLMAPDHSKDDSTITNSSYAGYPWQQNNNLLYLCGFDEPGSVLTMEKNNLGVDTWTLFVEGNDGHSLLWSGPRCGPETVINHFGLGQSALSKEFNHILSTLNDKTTLVDIDDNSWFSRNVMDSLANASPLNTTIDRMRLIKSPAEQTVMREAGRIAAESLRETIRWAKGTRKEADLAAKMEFECRLRGASGLAYVPVVAGGDRANIIHYVRNDRIIKDEEIVLMDAGAKFHGYCSDITRTFPISGRFASPHRELYEAVLRVQKRCIQAASKWRKFPDISLNTLNYVSMGLFIDELGLLGFRNPEKAVMTLFPHSIGHYIGMDLHDCQGISNDERLRAGMAITIEPGLYVPEHEDYPEKYHGIGIRIEDDILITPEGCETLTELVPKEVEELEQLMSN